MSPSKITGYTVCIFILGAISTPPVNTSVVEFMNASFDCAVTSIAPTNIEWWFTPSGSQQEQLVANQTGPQRPNYSIASSSNSLSLMIVNVRYLEHHGKYTCRSSLNDFMASAYLNVLCKSSMIPF